MFDRMDKSPEAIRIMPVFRRTLFIALVLILALAALPARVPSAAGAQPGDTITIGVTDLPRSLDPGDAYDMAAWEVLSHLYTGLTRQVPGTFEYELVLAQDYAVSDDKLTYAFTLRDGLTFTDGTPITAQTFVDSYNRVIALRQDALQAVEPYVSGVEAAENGQLVYHLVRPVPFFLALLSLPPYFPMHPDLAAADLEQPFTGEKIGNGPYLLENFEVRREIVLKANPDYAFGPPPATETIILKRYEKAVDLRNAFEQHEIDIAWRTLFMGHLFELEQMDGVQVVEKPSTRVFYIVMSQNREPTDDPLVRQAVTLLIERDTAIAEIFQGHLSPLTSLIPPQFPDAYAPLWPNDPDFVYAESILLQAGYNDRQRYRLEILTNFSQYAYGDPYAAAVVRLNRASFEGTEFINYGVFTDIEADTFFRMIEDGDSQLGFFAWTPIVPDPYAYLFPLVHSSQRIPANNRYAAPGLDALLDDAALLDDPAARGEIYQEIAEWLLDDHDLIPVWQDHVQVVAWNDIDGVEVEPNFFLHYDRLARR